MLAMRLHARGVLGYLRSDNGPEFIAQELRRWRGRLGRERLRSNREAPGKRVLGEF